MENTLKKIEFILELEKLKTVLRRNKPIGLDRLKIQQNIVGMLLF